MLMPGIRLPRSRKHPLIALTSVELKRLQAAWRSRGAKRQALEKVVAAAERFTKSKLVFPPEGSDHNQWYQCERCQMGLVTLSPTRHRCPKCRKVYSGAPYDNVLYARVHGGNFGGALNCARAWQLTGREKYARRAAKVLLGYAERYLEYPYHDAHRTPGSKRCSQAGARIRPQTLGESELMARCIAPAYDLIGGWPGLAAGQHRAIREKLIRPILENIDKNRMLNNWQSWHNAAMFAGGAVLRDANWTDRAVNSRKYGFYRQMQDMVTDEGMWFENSWAYHFYTLMSMFRLAEAARRAGLDLWKHPALRRMCEAPLRYQLPGGELPRNGDSTPQDVDFSDPGRRPVYEAAWNAYRTDEIADQLPKQPDWFSVMHDRPTGGRASRKSSKLASVLFPGAGHALLRRGKTDSAALLTFGTYTGFHSHFDMLNFIYYGRGEQLGIDSGRSISQAYRLPIHPDWYKNTLSHNAVVVDGKAQDTKVGASGKLLLYAETPEYAAAAASGDVACRGVKHARLLLLFDTYLLVLDELEARRGRSFDWFYHHAGESVRAPRGAKKVNVARRGAGYEYVKNARSVKLAGEVKLRFAGEKIDNCMTLAAGGATELVTGDGPFGSVLIRSPLVIARRRGKRAVFAATFEPVKGKQKPQIRSVVCEREGKSLVVTVARRGGEDRVVFDLRGRLDVVRG
jgi:Heparinase II/III-like protein/Alginate lyase